MSNILSYPLFLEMQAIREIEEETEPLHSISLDEEEYDLEKLTKEIDYVDKTMKIYERWKIFLSLTLCCYCVPPLRDEFFQEDENPEYGIEPKAYEYLAKLKMKKCTIELNNKDGLIS